MKTAVIYARFSCSKQREASIDDQVRVCSEWCAREGVEVLKTYSDYALSGRTDDRPQFQAMIEAAPESDYIVVYMFDRFSRNEYDAPMYKRELMMKGVRLVSATESIPDSPEGIIYEKLLEGLAACESRKTSIRTKRGMEGNALKCLYNGDRIYGYAVDPSTHRYIIDREQAAIVREVFERRLTREAVNHIASSLAARGVRTYTGKPCSTTMVSHMLKNERYTGVYIWGDVRVEGGMPAIIDRATWEAAQNVVGIKRRACERFDRFALSGRAVCGACGSNLFGVSGRGASGRKYTYYRCKCDAKPIPRGWLEATIADAVRGLMRDPSVTAAVARSVEAAVKSRTGDDARLSAARRRRDEAAKGIDNLIAVIERGANVPRLNERLAELQAVLDGAEAELAALHDADAFDVDDFAAFLRSGYGLDDETVLDAFVWQVVVFGDEVDVALNYDAEPGTPARLKLEPFAYGDARLSGENEKPHVPAVHGVREESGWLPVCPDVRTATGGPLSDCRICVANGRIVLRIRRAA